MSIERYFVSKGIQGGAAYAEGFGDSNYHRTAQLHTLLRE
jgi:hypothetical protein